MPLSCAVDYFGDCDDYAYYYNQPDDYSVMPQRKRRVRCKSCGAKIEAGAVCIEFKRHRYARNEIEERIYGEGPNVPMASFFHCEECADLWLSLTELGYTAPPDENQKDLVAEHNSWQ